MAFSAPQTTCVPAPQPPSPSASQTPWKCPKHAVACECTPATVHEDSMALETLVQSQWGSTADREAVLRKLRDCGIRSVQALKKSIQTPVWFSKVPRGCWFRGSPPLLNHLINERSNGTKMLKTSTLEAVARRCRAKDDLTQVEASVRSFLGGEDIESSDSVIEEMLSMLRRHGVMTGAELRAVLLLPPKELGVPDTLKSRLEHLLGPDTTCRHDGERNLGVKSFLTEGFEAEKGFTSALSIACDSEGEAKSVRERLRKCGIQGVWDMRLCLFTDTEEVHNSEFCLEGQSTLLNEFLRNRVGEKSMLKATLLKRLTGIASLEVLDGDSGVLFTAPHGIWLQRTGHSDHKPEVYTSFLASSFAACTESSSVVWSPEERIKSEYLSGPDPALQDPNYAEESVLNDLPWNRALQRHARRFRSCNKGLLHVDVHGRRDAITLKDGTQDISDCDIGVGAMLHMGTRPEAAQEGIKLRDELTARLSEVLSEGGFIVNKNPRMMGFLSGDEEEDPSRVTFHTMTMQSVRIGLRAVQLELSLRLRKELRYNTELRMAFGKALLETARSHAES